MNSRDERAQLGLAALNPVPADPRLLPSQPPRPESIRKAQRSSRFGLVDVMFGSGSLGTSGYSLRFERRADRWVFLFTVKGWIS